MVKVKPLEQIKANYRAGATVAPARYKAGVLAADWKGPAASSDAEALFAAKMSEAIAEERRRKGIERKTNADWRDPASNKGAARIGPGMTGAVEKQASGYSPYKSALEGVTLPARGADPMANVDARVKPVVAAMVNKKKELLG